MPLPADYPALLSRLDAWQEDVRARFPGVVPCRAGCSACCHGPFDISVADARLIRDTMATLPEAMATSIRERAQGQLERMRDIDPEFGAPWDVSRLGEEQFDELVDLFAEEPCPALDADGRCLVYAGRPLVCRVMGIGMETMTGDVIDNACPIRDEFPAYRDLPPQGFDLVAWEQQEVAALAAAADALDPEACGMEFETTIAGAIMLGAPRQ